MPGWQLERTRLSAGTWEGRLSGPAGGAPPTLVAIWRGVEIAPVRSIPAGEGVWSVVLTLPSDMLTDGVQTLSVGPPGADPLCTEAFAFGDPLELDLRAEVAALRTELEILRRALRRHLAQDH
jgi:hypothetical protein